LLYYRYVQRMTQQSVAEQLSISPRHLRREQEAAIRALAERLRGHVAASGLVEPTALDIPVTDIRKARVPRLDREIAWLDDLLTSEPVDVHTVIEDAVRLAQSMASSHNVGLSIQAADDLSSAGAASTILTQIILNLLTAAICGVSGGRVALDARASSAQVTVIISAQIGPQYLTGQAPRWDKAVVQMARCLAQLIQGDLSVAADHTSLTATVTAPCLQTNVIMAIEDNPDTLELWRRYLQNSRYRLIGIHEPLHAVETVARVQPSLILLDVMMPGTDGWKLLEQLSRGSATRHIPVIICTVLPQEELALTLGASGFIRKPVTRRDFMAAIERYAQRSSVVTQT
jgi:CheY-like chemotaxis protein